MRLEGHRKSENVEDKRGLAGPVLVGGGIGTLILLLIGLLLGGDPQKMLQQVQQDQRQAQAQGPANRAQPVDPEQEKKEFVEMILADTEDVWNEQFRKLGRTYEEPKLVLFSRQINSACGMADAAVGPFYCPADRKVYIDLAFYDELQDRFQAPGEFRQAYVVAHEIGHHVQNLLGLTTKVHARQQQVGKAEANQLSVRLELQADFLAGVWANHAQKARQILESGDIESGLNAASQIGDDRLQKEARGYVVPDSFTHGSSEQRVRWFRRGLQTGDMNLMMEAFENDKL